MERLILILSMILTGCSAEISDTVKKAETTAVIQDMTHPEAPADEDSLMTLEGFFFTCDNGSLLFITDDLSPIILSGSVPYSVSGIHMKIRTTAVAESYPMQAYVYDAELLPDEPIPDDMQALLQTLGDMGYSTSLHNDLDADISPGAVSLIECCD